MCDPLRRSTASSCASSARSSTGTNTAPAARTPSAATIHNGLLGLQSTTGTPCPNDRARRLAAKPTALVATIVQSQVTMLCSLEAIIAGASPRAPRSCSRLQIVQRALTTQPRLLLRPNGARLRLAYPSVRARRRRRGLSPVQPHPDARYRHEAA